MYRPENLRPERPTIEMLQWDSEADQEYKRDGLDNRKNLQSSQLLTLMATSFINR